MLAYDGSHILHTAIAYFNVVLVEKGVIFVLSRKVFRYELKEGFADVAAERRVIPDNVTLAVSSCSSCLPMFVIGEACCVSAGFEGVVIGSLVKLYIYIYLPIGFSSLNLPDECVSTKLRVAVNHVCFYLVTQFYTPLYTNVY